MRTTRRRAMAVAAGAAVSATAPQGMRAARVTADVAIVGAGVFGAWTAWHLARRGLTVRLLDQYGIGHARASSGGESRVIRLSYGGDAIYSPMARESLALWGALSARSPLPLLHRIGVLWFSPSHDKYMADSLGWLRANGVSHESGALDWLQRSYPQIAFDEGESGFFERDSGALMAARGVQSVVADSGLTPQRAQAGPPVRLSNGDYRVGEAVARHLVYACGPWLPELFPTELGGRIVPTRQEVYHFGPAPGDPRFSPPALPVWADFNGGDMVYGLPDLEGQGFKLAFDRHGAVVDPDTQDRRVSADGIAGARAYLARRFPGLADAPYVHGRVCQYENSSNGDFLIDRLPGHERVWLVGAGSGHGFKHGPAVGRRVADHILDAALAIEPRFALSAKAATQARTVY
ncbi:MAG TPA: FAD-dependent oxidoreductase [Novosphingobium sp.]|nr:FAD-dependent oxidoreductase [Novosphingobium sp.]